MTNEQLLAFLPFILLAAASIVVILLIAFRLSHTVIQVTGFLMMCMVILAMWYVREVLPVSIMPLFVVDGFGALFTGLIIFSVLTIGLFSFIYFEEKEENPRNIIFFYSWEHWAQRCLPSAAILFLSFSGWNY